MMKKVNYFPLFLLIFSFACGDECCCLLPGVVDLGKEKIVYGKDTVEVDVHMDKQKMQTVFRKSGKGVTIDSIVNSDGTYYVYEQEEWITVEEFPTSGRNDEPYWGINNAQTFAQVDNPTIGDCRYDFSDEHYYVTVGVSSQLQEMPYDKWQQTNIGDTVEVTFGSYFEYLFNTIGVRK